MILTKGVLNDMIFIWKDYCADYENKAEALFDSDAVKFTGCDDGFEAFYKYWLGELGRDCFHCKLVFENGTLIAIVAIAMNPENQFTIQEIVVAPRKRGKGFGKRILRELLISAREIIGTDINTVTAVIYPKNTAGIKVFESAGFIHEGTHPDGDALYYRYVGDQSRKDRRC